MLSVNVNIKPEEKASRVELLIRFLYMIPLAIVLMVVNVIASICIVINFFTSLILGKRISALNNFIALYIDYHTKVSVYLYLSDERPAILPETK